MIYVIIFILFLIIINSIIKEKNIYNPIVIFLGIWEIILVLASFKFNGMINYSDKSILIIGIGCVFFVIGAYVCKSIRKKKMYKNEEEKEKKQTYVLQNILLAIGLIAVILLAIKVISLLADGVPYAEIRNRYYSYGNSEPLIKNDQLYTLFNWGITGILYAMIPMVLVSIFEKTYNIKTIIGTILFLILYVFSTASRIVFVYTLLQLLILMIKYRKNISKRIKKICIITIATILALLLIITTVRADGRIFYSIYSYFSIPVPLLSYWIDYIDSNNIQTYGLASGYGIIMLFTKIIKMLFGLKFSNITELTRLIDLPQKKWIKVFANSKDYYNAFCTIFYYFYMDFRLIGVILGCFLLGALSYYIYDKSFKNKKYIPIYLILVQALFASFIRWQLASVPVIIAIILIIICNYDIKSFFKKKTKKKIYEKKNNRILVFGMTDNPGGVESVIMNYYRNIDRNVIQFDFLCNTEKVAYEEEITELGGKIYKITARSENRKKYKNEMKCFFEKHAKDYSTIWVNVCSLANIDYLIYAKKYCIKYRIIHSHNSKNMDSKLRGILHSINKRIIMFYATDFWACSKDAADWFFTKKIKNTKEILIINNAIDTPKYLFNEEIREEYRKQLKIENNYVVGNVGRLHFQKNHKFLIEIFNEILKRKENAVLLLIGQGEEKENIEKQIEYLGIKDKVIFLGARPDVPELLQAMDVFVFPSVFEGFGIAVLESQAAGLETFTSMDVVPKDVQITKNLKYISLDESAKSWADKIIDENPVDREKEREKIFKQISESGYDISVETKKIQTYFERS